MSTHRLTPSSSPIVASASSTDLITFTGCSQRHHGLIYRYLFNGIDWPRSSGKQPVTSDDLGRHMATTTTSRAAIVAAARTPIGTARKGTLANMPAIELAKPVVQAVVERSGLDAADFDGLVLAESMQGGGDSARYIAVALGLLEVPGLAVNRQCASSLSAIAVGAGQIASGMSRAILAGGMESLSTGPIMQKRKLFTTGKSPEDYEQWFPESHPPTAEA